MPKEAGCKGLSLSELKISLLVWLFCGCGSALGRPEDGQWPMPPKDFANTRFSGLDEITTTNVSKLKVAWTFSTGVARGQGGAPIVVSNLMFVATPYPNVLYALDLTNSGAVKWKYEPKPIAAAQGVACCDVVTRGACCADGKVFINTLDGYAIGLEASSGKELWKTNI